MSFFSLLGVFISPYVLVFLADTTSHRFDDPRKPLLDILGPEYEGKLTPIWGLNNDGDQRTAWRELGPGVENAWYMMGNFASCRFFSKHLALRKQLSFHLQSVRSLIPVTNCRDQSETGGQVRNEILCTYPLGEGMKWWVLKQVMVKWRSWQGHGKTKPT